MTIENPMPPPSDAPPRRKYRYTQQLVKMALEDMTQEEVAKVCRVSQSVVSGWLHGRSRAYEHQLAELKKRYAHRLHRATFRVYLALSGVPEGTREQPDDWEPYRTIRWTEQPPPERIPPSDNGGTTDSGARQGCKSAFPRRTAEIDIDHRPPASDGRAPSTPWVPLEPVERSRREWAPDTLRIVQVEGPVTLRHQLCQPRGVDSLGRPVRDTIGRWIVHHLERDRFVLVRQRRRRSHGPEDAIWARVQHGSTHYGREVLLEAGDDAARWLSQVIGPCTAAQLIGHADNAVSTDKGLLGAATLSFLVRKMLLELGYAVEGVDRIGPSE